MKSQDLCDDLAAILCPLPSGEDREATEDIAREEQDRIADAFRMSWQSDGEDPLLRAVHEARQRRLQAEQDLRSLIAYAREFMHPRPYRLIELADAAGLSISAVRINYDADDVQLVSELVGRPVPQAKDR